jgi:uncharacterized coiled-coil protein SlyX
MARTGPQKIPGASLSYFYGTGVFSGSDMEVNCGAVHTTEGRTVPSYADASGRSGANAPTATGLPDCNAKRLRWYQHYDVDESARALSNKLGGVQTNTANVFQIELVGTCDPKARDAWVRAGHRQNVDFIFWPEAPDWALAEVAWLVRWLHDNHGVPLTCVRDWLAYGVDARRPGVVPASYGASPARLSQSEWRAFKGWCGHQHVPENDHGDPGAMDFARVIALAKGAGAEQEEGPMAGMSNADICKAVWETDGVVGVPEGWGAAGNAQWKPSSLLIDLGKRVRGLEAQLGAQAVTIDKLVDVVAAGPVADLDALKQEIRSAIESVTVRLAVEDVS